MRDISKFKADLIASDEPFLWAWEGLRRNKNYLSKSAAIFECLTKNEADQKKVSPYQAWEKAGCTIPYELWTAHDCLEFGLSRWLPPDFPSKRINRVLWDRRVVSNIMLSAGARYVPSYIDEGHQRIIVIDNRVPKESQLSDIELILDEMGCVSKKPRKPDYHFIAESLAVYDKMQEPGISNEEIIEELFPDRIQMNGADETEQPADTIDLKDLSLEERMKLAGEIKQKKEEAEKREISAADNEMKAEDSNDDFLQYRRNYALVFIGEAKASEKPMLKSPMHYLDLIRYVDKDFNTLWSGQKGKRQYKKRKPKH